MLTSHQFLRYVPPCEARLYIGNGALPDTESLADLFLLTGCRENLFHLLGREFCHWNADAPRSTAHSSGIRFILGGSYPVKIIGSVVAAIAIYMSNFMHWCGTSAMKSRAYERMDMKPPNARGPIAEINAAVFAAITSFSLRNNAGRLFSAANAAHAPKITDLIGPALYGFPDFFNVGHNPNYIGFSSCFQH